MLESDLPAIKSDITAAILLSLALFVIIDKLLAIAVISISAFSVFSLLNISSNTNRNKAASKTINIEKNYNRTIFVLRNLFLTGVILISAIPSICLILPCAA